MVPVLVSVPENGSDGSGSAFCSWQSSGGCGSSVPARFLHHLEKLGPGIELLSVDSSALILSKNSGVSWAKIGNGRLNIG